MFIHAHLHNGRQVGSDIPATVFLLALFIFTTFTGMDLLTKAFVKQRAATGAEVAMRYLAVHPDDIAGAKAIVQSYVSNSFIPSSTLKVSAVLGLPSASCVPTSTCGNILNHSDGKYYFRDTFTVTALLTIPPFVPVPFLKSITTYVTSTGTLEIYGCPAGGC